MPQTSSQNEKLKYEVLREGDDTILNVDYTARGRIPSIEDDEVTMSEAITLLIENPTATRIIFMQKHEYEYDFDQVSILSEIAQLYSKLVRNKEFFSYGSLANSMTSAQLANKYNELHNVLFEELKKDPLACYVKIKRLRRGELVKLDKEIDQNLIKGYKHYIKILEHLLKMIEQTKFFALAKPYVEGFEVGNRDVYRRIFSPMIKPDFMFTKLMATYPKNGVELDNYVVGDTEVVIFETPDSVQYIYHIMPPEFKLTEEVYDLLDTARKILSEHKPDKKEFTDPMRMREVFHDVGKDLLQELAGYRKMELDDTKIDELAGILVRYTVGFGLIEVLLLDEKTQDISVNSPLGELPIFIVHSDYDDCVTNIYPTVSDTKSWATKLRMISGRPLDEANPILDTEIELPNANVRTSTISQPLDPTGLAFSFRRHRNKPWTLPLFLKVKMISPLAAGLLSFLIDGARTMLVCGTRSSGKSSFLSSLLIEIMRRHRIITIEDSITGDSIIEVNDNGTFRRTTVEEYFDFASRQYGVKKTGSKQIIELPDVTTCSMVKEGTFSHERTTRLMKHKVKKQLYEIVTQTGRKLSVTKDHSIFTVGEDELAEEITPERLQEGDQIIVPAKLPSSQKNVFSLSIPKLLLEQDDRSLENVYVKCNPKKLRENKGILKKHLSKARVQHCLRTGVITYSLCKQTAIKTTIQKIKHGPNSQWIDATFSLDETTLKTLGLWIAGGSYDRNSIIFSVSSKEERSLVKTFAEQYGFETKSHSDNFSLMIHSKSLRFIFTTLLECTGNAHTKHIPSFVYTLSDKQKGFFLQGFFSGDGCCFDKEMSISSASLRLLDDLQSLLLHYGIILRINRLRERKTKENDRTKDGWISDLKSIEAFEKNIGFLQQKKNTRLQALARTKSTHQSNDGVVLPDTILEKIAESCPRTVFNTQDHMTRKNAIGRKKLESIATYLAEKNPVLSKQLMRIAKSKIYFDKVVSMRKLPQKEQDVYDFSVPGAENFVASNILAHNTLELPTGSMRNLGFNIQPLKVAGALAKGGGEVDAQDGIRSTLRLGDSSLIVGEVCSKEAKALYEAMRVGAAANVVAGTIHGDSPYGIFDRLVNDIGIPKTSFKATDIIIIANPIKSADGLHKLRRVLQITEVRKSWDSDPNSEGGFVDLMKYNADTDTLEPTKELLNGESDILKDIASKIKEYTGDWDAMWENIKLRAKTKERIMEISEENDMPELLEAEFVILANDKFHKTVEKVTKKNGKPDNDKIYFEWNSWLEREMKRRKLKKEGKAGEDDEAASDDSI